MCGNNDATIKTSDIVNCVPGDLRKGPWCKNPDIVLFYLEQFETFSSNATTETLSSIILEAFFRVMFSLCFSFIYVCYFKILHTISLHCNTES